MPLLLSSTSKFQPAQLHSLACTSGILLSLYCGSLLTPAMFTSRYLPTKRAFHVSTQAVVPPNFLITSSSLKNLQSRITTFLSVISICLSRCQPKYQGNVFLKHLCLHTVVHNGIKLEYLTVYSTIRRAFL